MKQIINTWLKAQKTTIESLICEASTNFANSRYIDRDSSNFLFDLKECEQESLALSRGGDLCYDRHSIGMSYALWYQGRRLNTSLSYCLDFVVEAIQERKPLEIFDLGAGTGAVQLAIGLCLEGAKQAGYELPEVRVVNVDISPFMLDFNRSFLSKSFASEYPSIKRISSEYSVNSWMNPNDITLENPIIVASYLFDHEENKEDIAANFRRMVERYKPGKLVLLTSGQTAKIRFLNEVAAEIVKFGYQQQAITKEDVFSGPMNIINQYRSSFNQQYGSILSSRTPTWSERSFTACLLTNKNPKLSFDNSLFSSSKKEINLYLPPIKIRKEIQLNDQQKAAAIIDDRPTIITGPAGCGKSVVISERVKNLCDRLDYQPSLRILVTTFNKELMDYLADWLTDLLNPIKVQRRGNDFYFSKSVVPNVRLLHFDVLPTRIAGINDKLEFDDKHLKYLSQAVEEVCNIEEIDRIAHQNILLPRFLLDEYERVIYGQQFDTVEEYQIGKRQGRPYILHYNSEKRAIIWKIINHYLHFLEDGNISSIQTRRHKLLRQLKDGHHQMMFSHIFVDEFQDCTQADYQIFYGLLKDNNQLVIAGDYAQAVHLGKSATAPREDEVFQGKVEMRRRIIRRLDGSFRLPFRISECLRPFSEFIKQQGDSDTDIITPYKGAPPGARPIVVYGSDTEIMKQKLIWIFWYFQIFDLFDADLPRRKKITILEKDFALKKALNARIPEIAETDTILRLKGMEKDCIVWSTRADLSEEDDAYYYIYTILTRTCSVLIIALFPDTKKEALTTLQKMEPSRLMMWDEETVAFYERRVNPFVAETVTSDNIEAA